MLASMTGGSPSPHGASVIWDILRTDIPVLSSWSILGTGGALYVYSRRPIDLIDPECRQKTNAGNQYMRNHINILSCSCYPIVYKSHRTSPTLPSPILRAVHQRRNPNAFIETRQLYTFRLHNVAGPFGLKDTKRRQPSKVRSSRICRLIPPLIVAYTAGPLIGLIPIRPSRTAATDVIVVVIIVV